MGRAAPTLARSSREKESTMTRVFCDVRNCVFNEDELCAAREIRISPHSMLAQVPEPESALGGGASGIGMSVTDEARTSEDTACATFRPRDASERS